MIDLKYDLIIEATADPNFFGFYSPLLEGFTGVGHSIEDCLYKAKWGMEEHVELLREQGNACPRDKHGPDDRHPERGREGRGLTHEIRPDIHPVQDLSAWRKRCNSDSSMA